jgi:aminomethyltransferase
MARIEAGLLLIDVDFHSSNKVMYEIQKSSPFELNLDWTVALEKEFFVGQSALQAEKRHGIACSTVGLEVDLIGLETLFSEFGMPLTLPYQAWNDAIPVYGPDGQIGKATSGTWSPILKKYIVLARVPQKYARPGVRVGLEVTIEGHRKPINAEVVQTPFFNPPRKMA